MNNDTNKFFNKNMLDNLIKKATNIISCDDKCKHDKKEKELLDKFNEVKNDMSNINNKYDESEKNYYIHKYSEQYYDDLKQERTNTTVERKKKQLTDKHTNYIKQINSIIEQYNINYTYYSEIDKIYNSKINENKLYLKKIDDFKSNINVNNRKVFYQNIEINNLHFFRIILLVIYYIILCVILYHIDFINNEYYKNKLFMFGIIIYILFGLYVDYISYLIYIFTIYIYHWFDKKSPRNIYVSL